MRPLRFGGWLAGAGAGGQRASIRLGGVGAELEIGLARALVAWIQTGLMGENPYCVSEYGLQCLEQASGWSVVLGGSLFPTAEDLPVMPFAGLGAGIGVRSGDIESVTLFRLGIELDARSVRPRLELRGGSHGWGIGLGVMF